jgi:protein involved in polysaccharide export with SLBB domain
VAVHVVVLHMKGEHLFLIVLRLSMLLALLSMSVAHAQYCGPTGINALGQRCDPTQSNGQSPGQMTAPQGSGTAAWPPQQGAPATPVITNRVPMGTLDPQQQSPGTFDSQRRGMQFPQTPMPDFNRLPRERNEFQDLVLQSVGRDLPMFGYNLFSGVPSTFAPVDGAPVTSDYVIGPGDEILVRAWGAVDIDYRAVVDRNGLVSIPRIGNITVAGVRYQDLQPLLKSAVGRVFRNFELNASLGQLRSMQIFVVGHATRPGNYTVSSLSTLVNALFASGGPTLKGSLRKIQLKRRDKLITQFDMYDLLLRGDKSKDVSLLPGDVIYIPPIGSLAAVSGSVNNPAIYELNGEKTLGQLLELASGLATTADGQKVAVERIVDRRSRNVEEFTLDNQGLAHAVRDGDLVTVLQLSPRFDRTVTVRGNVALPARHPWRAGLRVRDVVPDRESLIVPDYWIKRNLIVRPDVTGRETYGLRPDLASDLRPRGLQGEQQTWQRDLRDPNQPGFHDRDPRQQQWQEPAQDNDPRMQGQEPLQQQQRQRQQQQQQADFERRAPQVKTEIKQHLPEVNWDYAVIERLNREDLTTQLIPFNLGKAILEGDPQNNIALQAGDVITVFSKIDIQVPTAKQTKFVRLEGEVATPGVYQVLPGETLRQLLVRVGGFSRNAYIYGAELSRESVRVQQQNRLSESLDRLAQEVERNAAAQAQRTVDPGDTPRALAQAESQRRLLERLRAIRATGRIVLETKPDAQLQDIPEIALEDGDRFIVPSRPSTVGVVGAVYNQNTFVYDRQKRVTDYLGQAGGSTRDADSARVYVIRADGSVAGRAQGRFFTMFGSESLNPGDTIVVPENLDRFSLTRELKDWSQIFYQFALGVAGLKVLQGL